MTTSIVLIPVAFDNARKVCDLIENQKYNNTTELRDFLKKELVRKKSEDEDEDEETENEQPLIYDLTDFMEEVNDQNLDVMTNYFISYVQFV